MSKKISIIIPCFNKSKFIADTVNSVLKQDFSNIEIICINDGSSDNTSEILHKISDMDSRVVVIDQKNAGSSAARNRGISASSGEYICFLDADDLFLKNTLSSLYESAVKFDSDIVIGDFVAFNELGVTQYKSNFIHENGPAEYESYFNDYFSHNKECYPSVCFKLYKTSLIKNNAIFFPDGIFTAEDVCFSAKAIVCARKISKVNQEVYRYRIGENNESGFKNIKVFQDVKIVCEELECFFNEHASTFNDIQNKLLSSYLIKTRFLAPLTAAGKIDSKLYKQIMNLTYPDLDNVRKKSGFSLLETRYKALFYLYEICPNQKIFEFTLKMIRKAYLLLRKFV